MARRYDSKEAKRRILTACVRLFLEKGYTNTKAVSYTHLTLPTIA